MHRTALALSAALAFATGCAGDDEANTDTSSGRCAELAIEAQRLLEEEHAASGFPGLIFALRTEGCGTQRAAAGANTLEPPTPMTSDRIATISSTTKTFVATVVMRLVEAQMLSLDAPLATWRPAFPQAQAITVRQLLNHTSGVRDHWLDTNCSGLQAPTHDELIACVATGSPEFPPGTKYDYSNTNYVLLGVIIEAITGRSLHTEIRERILTPLELADAYFLDETAPTNRLMHTYLAGVDITGQEDPNMGWGSGDMLADADDLAKFFHTLLRGDFLEPTSLAEMTTFSPTDGFPPGEYGLGLASRSLDDGAGNGLGEIWGHGGRGDAMSEAFYAPAWDATAVLLVNQQFTTNIWLPNQILDRMFIALGPRLPPQP